MPDYTKYVIVTSKNNWPLRYEEMAMKHHFLQFIYFTLLFSHFTIYSHGFTPQTPLTLGDNTLTTLDYVVNNFKEQKPWTIAAYDKDTHNFIQSFVIAVHKNDLNDTDETYTLIFDDHDDNNITCSAKQQFYCLSSTPCTWKSAADLIPGDSLLCLHDHQVILQEKHSAQPQQMYTFSVYKTNTFIVGNYQVVTHNIALPTIIFSVGFLFDMIGIGGISVGAINCGIGIAWGLLAVGINKLFNKKSPSVPHKDMTLHTNTGSTDNTISHCDLSPPNSDQLRPCGTGLIQEKLPMPSGPCLNDINKDLRPTCATNNTFNHDIKPLGCGTGKIKSTDLIQHGQCNSSKLSAHLSLNAKTIENVVNGATQNNKPKKVTKTFEDIIQDLPKQKASGRSQKTFSEKYHKQGNYETAKEDFYSLNPTNIKHYTKKDGKIIDVGILSDGNKAVVRNFSSRDKFPTLEIQLKNEVEKNIKIRYITDVILNAMK